MLAENNIHPAVICFYTERVKLAAAGSPVLDALKALELKGTRLVLCIICLDYCGLTDKVQVGIAGGMTDIIEAQRLAGKVIAI